MNDAQRKIVERLINRIINAGSSFAPDPLVYTDALRALLAQSTPPPREPTHAMIDAGMLELREERDAGAAFVRYG
jgi:hypothetical protein